MLLALHPRRRGDGCRAVTPQARDPSLPQGAAVEADAPVVQDRLIGRAAVLPRSAVRLATPLSPETTYPCDGEISTSAVDAHFRILPGAPQA